MAKKKTAKKKASISTKKGPIKKFVDDVVAGIKKRVGKRKARRKRRKTQTKKA